MTGIFQSHFEKFLLGFAALAVAASGTWLGRQQDEVRQLRARPPAVGLIGARHVPADLKLPDTRTAVWSKAPPQSQGADWHFEVFTPPVIYYHRLARSLSVTPPLDPGGADTPFGLRLLGVRPEQFRLQLVGYFGAPGDYLAAFTSPDLPGTLLAREGRHFAELGLTLKSFAVEKISLEHNDLGPVYDIAGLAVLTDDRNGGEVVLDSRARKTTDHPLAVLQSLNGGQSREVREGETFSEENSTYRIERIQLDPPEVVVARLTPGLPQPETKVLQPAATKASGQAGAAAKPKTLPSHPAHGLVSSDR